MKFTQKQGIIIFGAFVLILVVGFLIWFGSRSTAQTQKVTLNIWGTDPTNVFNDISSAYKAAYPNVTISYTQVDPGSYQTKLLSALAAGTGPDLFEIGNRQLPQWQSVLAPIPASLLTQFNATTLESDFPDVVSQDFVADGNVYAMPLDVDTIAMFYNKDLFNSASIVYPPKTWDDLEIDIPKLRVLNTQGQITQAAVALGGSETSIAIAPDLVFLLMLQNGTQMISSDGTAANFDSGNQTGGTPGVDAFNFYLQFANSASPYYTWNDGMGDAVQSFIQGKTAILFDYASAKAEIAKEAPFLNYGIAPMVQPASATIGVNYPKYEGLAVAKYGQVSAAWQFLLYLTTNANGEKIYTDDLGEPPASRSFIAANLNDPNYGVFAEQALTARSWREVDDTQIDSIMNTAIENVLNGSNDSGRALGVAQDAVTSLIQGQQ